MPIGCVNEGLVVVTLENVKKYILNFKLRAGMKKTEGKHLILLK